MPFVGDRATVVVVVRRIRDRVRQLVDEQPAADDVARKRAFKICNDAVGQKRRVRGNEHDRCVQRAWIRLLEAREIATCRDGERRDRDTHRDERNARQQADADGAANQCLQRMVSHDHHLMLKVAISRMSGGVSA